MSRVFICSGTDVGYCSCESMDSFNCCDRPKQRATKFEVRITNRTKAMEGAIKNLQAEIKELKARISVLDNQDEV